jgi:O-antigen ligase
VTQTYFGFNLEQRILRPEIERDQETVSMRFTYWQTALNNFRNFPLFGTGPNTYNVVSDFPLSKYYSRGVREYTFRLDKGIGVHNIFIERLADTGLFGFGSFVALILFFGKEDVLALLRLKQSKDQEAFKTYLLYSLSSWSWVLYGVTDNGYGAQGFMTFFFIRGLLPHVYQLAYDKK